TTDDFSSGVETYPATDVVTQNGVAMGTLSVHLDGGQAYAWRVRVVPDDPTFSCWRPAAHFTTAGHKPTPISPIKQTIHPWDATFDWTDVSGATRYEFEVWKGNARKVADESPQSTAPVDLPVASTLRWRVRAVVDTTDGDSVDGGWSEWADFDTSMP